MSSPPSRHPSRPHLLLVPGLLCTGRLWREQIAALGADCEITVATHNRDDSIPAIAQRILAAAPERFAVAGLSMGGYIAFELWRQAPERITRLALLDTRASPDSPEETQRRKDLLVLAEQGRFVGMSERMMPMFVHPDRLDDAALTAAVTQMATETGKDGFVRQTTALLQRADARALCPEITAPTLILTGREDRITPLAAHEEMADLIPNSELVIVERCGHLSTMERAEEVNAALQQWLARDG